MTANRILSRASRGSRLPLLRRRRGSGGVVVPDGASRPRSRRRLALAGVFLLLGPLVSAARAEAPGDVFSVRRFLLSAGSNRGGTNRVELRFADTDARAVSRVFQDLGGVEPGDQVLLLDSNPTALRRALTALEQQMAAARRTPGRIEVIVYYSGHSDEEGLLLAGERLDYRELRAAVDRLPADVRIIILDSCASGAFTRSKGGARRPPFLLDTSTKLTGHAFLTSSSQDEAAQESDRLGGSFFTHALLSGLRGAADATQDHRVTLNEAYQFAYQNTLARTEGTRSGPQHAGYDIQMVGAGDLVLTDLHDLTAGLLLAEDLEGRLHVRDRDDGLVVELQKPRGRTVELGLEPGEYRIFLDRDGDYFTSALALAEGDVRQLRESDLLPMAAAATRARGEYSAGWRSAPPAGVVHRPLLFTLWPGRSGSGVEVLPASAEIALNLTVGRNHSVDGLEIGTCGNWNLRGFRGCQLSGGVNLVEGAATGFQIAGLGTRVHQEARAVQCAGVANSVGGDHDGMQWAGVLNIVEGNCGFFQGSGVANLAWRDVRGVQLAGVGNLGRRLHGVQAGGVLNVASAVHGAQVAGVLNLARSPVREVQDAGNGNDARSLRGLQLSVVNLCGTASGAQIGAINVARSIHGTQIGVLNLADEVSGAPVGVLSLVRRGRHQAAAWSSDVAPANVGIKLGNRHAYSILTVAGESFAKDRRRFGGGGLGVEIPYGRLFGQIEAICYDIGEPRRPSDHDDSGLHILNRATFGLGWQAAPHLAIVGGLAVNVFNSKRNQGGDLIGRPVWFVDRKGPTYTRVWPGFFAGVQL